MLEQAERAPSDLVGRSDRITIDEVQRAPQLLHSVKLAVDKKRTRGRFLLTGSANLLLMRRIAESLAGRATYLTLWPLTRREQLGMGSAGIWSDLLSARLENWLDLVEAQRVKREDRREAALRGGYPTPAIELDTPDDRSTWFMGYTRTYLERDLQEISSVTGLPDLRRLMRAACLRIGQLINQTELARDIALPQPTVHRHLNLLETSYSARAVAGICRQPHQTSDQNDQALLGRYGPCVPPCRTHRPARVLLGEPRTDESAWLGAMPSQELRISFTGVPQPGKKWISSSKRTTGSFRLKSRQRHAPQQATSVRSIHSDPSTDGAALVRFCFTRVNGRSGWPLEFWRLHGGVCCDLSSFRSFA